MDAFYFLLFIGLCAMGLVWLIVRSTQRAARRTAEEKRRHIWRNRRRRAHAQPDFPGRKVGRGSGRSYIVAATKINSDEEIDADAEEEISMREFEFHSLESGRPKKSNTKS